MGGTNETSLWYPDHIVQGVLQTLEYDYPCIDTRKYSIEVEILKREHPEYVEMYWVAYHLCQSHAGRVSGLKQWGSKLGMFARDEDSIKESSRKGALVVQKRLGPLLGLTPEQIVDKNTKSAKTQKERGTGMFGVEKRERSTLSRGAMTKTNSQRWEDPDHPELGTHSSGTLTQMQKRRNLPHGKENRVEVY
jgi:hypothetical protein